MQTLNSVRLADKLVVTEDLADIISVVEKLPIAEEYLSGQYRFLSECCTVNVKIAGTVVRSDWFQSGKIYKCTPYNYVDPRTGVTTVEYKWVVASFVENGRLTKVTDWIRPIPIENGSAQGGGYTCCLHWNEPTDNTNPEDPAMNAVWAYTVVVRKFGAVPKTVFDGEIVGYSSVRGQYKGGAGFYDHIPVANYYEGISDDDFEKTNYNYNVFVVTRYGVATGLYDRGDSNDWDSLRRQIWDGTSGLAVGSTLNVSHNIFGDMILQVVDVREGDATLVNPDSRNTARRSVVLMSYQTLPVTSYDVPELAVDKDGRENPGDNGRDEDKCSLRGRAIWGLSNLRQWLNQDVYTKTSDTVWDLNKTYATYDSVNKVYSIVAPSDNPRDLGYYEVNEVTGAYVATTDINWDLDKTYFRKLIDGSYLKVDTITDSPASHGGNYYEFTYVKSTDQKYDTTKCYYTVEDGEYVLVPDPINPSSTSPLALGYYESYCRYKQLAIGSGETNTWDLFPNPTARLDPTAGYVWNGKVLPGLLSGFGAGFRSVLATVSVNTITDPYTTNHVAAANRRVVTEDKVFIPSHREIFGDEPSGIRDDSRYTGSIYHEGSQFKFYNKSFRIPDMSAANRSVLKECVTGELTGYWLRTVATALKPGSTNWYISSPSALWMTYVSGHKSRSEAPLGTLDVVNTHKCSITVREAAEEKTVYGIPTAPAVAWCVVIG